MADTAEITGSSLTSGVCALPDLGVLGVRGVDALRFLQGQLSSDTQRLASGGAQLAGLHTPQGRTVAVLRLVAPTPTEVLAVLPRELVPAVRARLAKFVLRAKLALTDESASWQVHGIVGSPLAPPSASIALALGGPCDRMFWLTPDDSRVELEAAVARAPQLSRADWRRLDIAAGLPQIYPATSEAFVAQMLNLDLLGGIAFDKGCYTGQEVIARAHYRGRVKRRLQGFRTRTPAPAELELVPGSRGRLADGRSFSVLEAERCGDGQLEFLAVTALAANSGDASNDDEAPAAEAAVDCETLELPYALPND